MKLYLIRHGQSTANLYSKLSTPETHLSERGIEDAKCAGALLQHCTFDKVFVSPYLRAIETLEHAMPGVEGEIVDCLHECDCGNIEGKLYADVMAMYGEEFTELMRIDDYTRFGGEDYESVRNRVREFMSIVEPLECEKIAAFSHAGFILAFFDEVMNRPGKPGRNINCVNGSVNVFEYKDGTWRVSAFNITPVI